MGAAGLLTCEIHQSGSKRPERPKAPAGSGKSSCVMPYRLWMSSFENPPFIYFLIETIKAKTFPSVRCPALVHQTVQKGTHCNRDFNMFRLARQIHKVIKGGLTLSLCPSSFDSLSLDCVTSVRAPWH